MDSGLPRSSCVKLYLCSDPEDSVLERRALRERAFPKLSEHCRHTLGRDVRVIDPFESDDPSRWPDEDTRQQLINECRESSAGPFLLKRFTLSCCFPRGHAVEVQALVGRQYGAAALPTRVEASEYQLLLHVGQEAGISTQEVERLYKRDENSIPTSYRLTPPSRLASAFQLEREEEVAAKARGDELVKVLQTAAGLCVNRGLMAAERAMRYYRSAMDADLRYALEDRLESDIIRRCVVYVHNILNPKGQRPKTTVNSETLAPSEDLSTAPSDGTPLSQLCDNFLPALVNSSRILVYTTTTECDRRHGYTTARRKAYVESLCQQMHHDLVGLIKRASISESGGDEQVCDALDRGGAEQEDICGILAQYYDVVRPEEKKVRLYVEQREHQRPLVVTGGPCTGKAVLLAHCAQQIKSWLPDSGPVVLTYFCQMSTNLSPKQLLFSLCRQILRRYQRNASSLKQSHGSEHSHGCTEPRHGDAMLGFPSDPDLHRDLSHTEAGRRTSDCWKNTNVVPFDIIELRKTFCSLLSLMPSTEEPLFLIFDGLDHMENHCGSQILNSLPYPLPPNVKVIVSVSSNRTWHRLDTMLGAKWKESGCVSVPLGVADRKLCMKMLASLLSSCGRRVTSGQQALVNQALTSCCLTLYVRLLALHVSLWQSDTDEAETSLPDGVHSSISALLARLEQKHGAAVVKRAASYLALSRTGLTEAELADLLSSDHQVLSSYLWRGEEAPSVVTVPHVDVETLLLDLRRFLIRRTAGGLQVLSWASRHFKLVITKRYLFTVEARKEIHAAMADYFSSRWSCGNAKPLLIDFPNSPRGGRRVNMRKILELPHHLQESEKWEQLEGEVLLSFRFHQAMVQAGFLGDLVAMLESKEGLSHSRLFRERAFIASVFKSCACLLQGSPLQLATVMETNLFPYLEVFPALNVYLSEIRLQRREMESRVGVALCPAPSSVPSVLSLQFHTGNGNVPVAEVAVTDGGIVAQIMDDGTAWFWPGPGSDVAKLSLTSERRELRFAGVKGSAHFILLSTLCGRLFFWNAEGPETFVPLHVPRSPSQHAPTKLEGFVAHRTKLFTWWESESSVNMLDISDETAMQFPCQSCVTCSVCSSDGSHLYCGQEGGAISLFDTDTGAVLATWSNPSHKAISWMSVSKEKLEVTCGDKTGSIATWEVAAKTHPPRLIKESVSGDDFDEVLNTDYSDDTHTLLVCRPRQVSLWNTCNWELWDQFSAPQEKLFARAVLSHSGNLLLALLDTCPFVLVWRVSTGECVLSLKTNKQPRTLLKSALGVMCIDLDAHLTVWDSASIEAAGAAPKMGRGVQGVVVEPTGECFYTTDGSETVWRWQFETGLPRAHILHEDPVEKLCLSPDSLHLVTLSAGDVYVWRTETGQNIVRVTGSRATDVLITPNGNFGVSISEQHLSQVWKLTQGSIVCSVRLHLSDAQVSPESTFLIGRHRGDLLAASLWSGSISKRFSCVASRELVAAFRTLPEHPDIVMVMGASGALYTWNVAEETVCRHFQLPRACHCGPRDFQMSSDGSYALLSKKNEAITILDLSQVMICSLKTEGQVLNACLDKTGCYVTYISAPSTRGTKCTCSLHSKPLLTVVRLADGKRMGSTRLSKQPLTLHMCERRYVFVGFGDGTVGVYCISDASFSGEASVAGNELTGQSREGPLDRWLPLPTPNVTWLHVKESSMVA